METPSTPLLRTNRSWLIPSVALGLIIIGSGVAYTIVQDRTTKVGELTVTTVGENAFGDLSYSLGVGSDARTSESTTLTADAPTTAVGSAGDASTLIYPSTAYSFVYNGPAVPQTESKLAVYRRIIPTGPTLGGLLGTRSPFTKPSFSGATVQSLGISQGTDKYRADMDFVSGYLNISLDMSSSGYVSTSSPANLEDSRLIAIANAFIEEMGISQAGLGEPEVMSSIATDLPAVDAAVSSEMSTKPIYTAEQTVIYPLTINGLPVYDFGGSKVGMTVTIDTGMEKVLYLSKRLGTELESSLYSAITDFDTIKTKLAEDSRLKLMYQESATKQEIMVETPTLAFVQATNYDGATPSELYVPAFVFPITSADQGKIYMRSVVIPLVEGVISDGIRTLDGSTGSIEPMPAEAR